MSAAAYQLTTAATGHGSCDVHLCVVGDSVCHSQLPPPLGLTRVPRVLLLRLRRRMAPGRYLPLDTARFGLPQPKSCCMRRWMQQTTAFVRHDM